MQGEPNSSANEVIENKECFPYALLHTLNSKGKYSTNENAPLGIDFRKSISAIKAQNIFLSYNAWLRGYKQRDEGILKLIAGLLKADYGDLKQREKVRQRLKYRAIASTAFLLSLIGSLLLKSSIEATEKAQSTLYEKHVEQINTLEQNAINFGWSAEAALWNIKLWQINLNNNKPHESNHLIRTNFLCNSSPKICSYSILEEDEKIILWDRKNKSCIVNKNDSLFSLKFEGLKQSFLGKMDKSENHLFLNWSETLKRIAYCNQDKTLHFWNFKNNSINTSTKITGYAFPHSNEFFISRDVDEELYINTQEGQKNKISLPNEAKPLTYGFSQSNSLLVITSKQEGSRLFLLHMSETGKINQYITIKDWGEDEPFVISRWSVSEDDSKIACKDLNGNITVFSTSTGNRLAGPHKVSENVPFDTFLFSPDGNKLFLTQDNKLHTWELNEKFKAYSPLTFQEKINDIAISNDGFQINIACSKQIFFYSTLNWNYNTSPVKINSEIELLLVLPNNNLFIRTKKNELFNMLLPDYKSIIRIAWQNNQKVSAINPLSENNIQIFTETDDHKKMLTIQSNNSDQYFQNVEEGPVSRLFLTNNVYLQQKDYYSDVQIKAHNAKKNSDEVLFDIPFKECPGIPRWAISPSCEWLASAPMVGNKIKIWKHSDNTVKTIPISATGTDKIVFSSNSSYVAFAGSNGNVSVIDLTTDEFISKTFKCGLGIRDVFFLPDNKEFVVSTTSGDIQFWNIKNNPTSPNHIIKFDEQARKIELSEDGKWLTALDFDAGFLSIWNFKDLYQKEIRLAFSSYLNSDKLPKISTYHINSENNLVWMSDDHGNVAAWSLLTGKLLIPLLKIDGSIVHSIATHKNSSKVFFGSELGNIFIMDINPLQVNKMNQTYKELKLLTGIAWDEISGSEKKLEIPDRIELAKELQLWMN